MKQLLLTSIGILILFFEASTQISLLEADEVVQNKFPQYTPIHTYNSPTMFQNPQTGQYTMIHTVGAGHHPDSTSTLLAAVTDRYQVSPDQQSIVDADPKRHLWTYDRSEYQNINQFADSLDIFLSKHFTITSNSEGKHYKDIIQIFPNPVKKDAALQVKTKKSEAWSLSIYDVSGRLLYNTNGKSESNGLNIEIPFSAYPVGVYFVALTSSKSSYCTRVLKK